MTNKINYNNNIIETEWRTKILKKLFLILSIFSFFPTIIYYSIGAASLPFLIAVLFLSTMLLVSSILIKSDKNINLCISLLIYLGGAIILFLSTKTGGISSHLVGWLMITVLLTVFLYNKTSFIAPALSYTVFLILILGYLTFKQGLIISLSSIYIKIIAILMQVAFVAIFSYLFKKERENNLNLINEQQLMLSNNSKLKAVSEMSKGLSHEINNPLTQIRGYIELINEEILNEKFDINLIKEYIDEITLGSNKISSIVSKTQEFTKNINYENRIYTQVTLIIEQSLILLKAKIERHKPVIEYLNCSIEIACVPSLTIHALTNVLSNAIDYVYKNSESKIKIYCEKTDNQINIIIENNGPEIPENILPRIFEPFFTTKVMGKGVGLGLSMAYNIMQQQEGSINCTSNSNSTKFILSLPV